MLLIKQINKFYNKFNTKNKNIEPVQQIQLDKLVKKFNLSRSKLFLLDCYDIIVEKNNFDILDSNPIIMSCLVKLKNLTFYEEKEEKEEKEQKIQLDCEVISLYEGVFGCKELIDGENISLIIKREKIFEQNNYNSENIDLDRIFSFYSPKQNNLLEQIQKKWIEINFEENNLCYIRLTCLDNNDNNDNNDN